MGGGPGQCTGCSRRESRFKGDGFTDTDGDSFVCRRQGDAFGSILNIHHTAGDFVVVGSGFDGCFALAYCQYPAGGGYRGNRFIIGGPGNGRQTALRQLRGQLEPFPDAHLPAGAVHGNPFRCSLDGKLTGCSLSVKGSCRQCSGADLAGKYVAVFDGRHAGICGRPQHQMRRAVLRKLGSKLILASDSQLQFGHVQFNRIRCLLDIDNADNL